MHVSATNGVVNHLPKGRGLPTLTAKSRVSAIPYNNGFSNGLKILTNVRITHALARRNVQLSRPLRIVTFTSRRSAVVNDHTVTKATSLSIGSCHHGSNRLVGRYIGQIKNG